MTSLLNGCRVLLVEDESLIAMFLEGILEDDGCEVIGPFCRIETAVEAANGEAMIDIALLDVNLGRSAVFPVAEVLQLRNIPFVFMTGYGLAGVPEHFANRPVVTKPYTRDMVINVLAQTLEKTTPENANIVFNEVRAAAS